MSKTVFEAHYPTLCRLLAGTSFEDEAKAASAMGRPELKEVLRREGFRHTGLISVLCGVLVPEWTDVNGAELEANLARIEVAIGIGKARAAFRDKLLTREERTLEDVLYEIAITARACTVLDAGSVQLERPIPDPRKEPIHFKNSDIYGTYRNHPIRIEVTVLHEKPPQSVDLDLVEILESTELNDGFSIQMRSPLQDEFEAKRARALLELLHEHHTHSGGADVEVDGIRFNWQKPRYVYISGKSPFESVRFYGAEDPRGGKSTREVNHGVSVRNVTPGYVRDLYPNPPGIFDLSDLPDAPKQVPVSTKIWQMLDGKLQQCEAGVINIVAFGNPRAMNDDEVYNALFGPEMGVGTFTVDQNGIRHLGEASIRRVPNGPFTPAKLATADVLQQFIDPFRKMSAVWHIRLGNSRMSELILNPNAQLAVPRALATDIDPRYQRTRKNPILVAIGFLIIVTGLYLIGKKLQH